ncbi:MAG TPA: hypothetical protein PKE55_11155 [Kiritimatiellia bacterium]|nr:hypothetical protein [Kiritimatiellia bacterium]
MKQTIGWMLLCGLMAAGCASPPEPRPQDPPQLDPMLAQWSANAQDAFEKGMYSRAASLYRMTVDRATMADNSMEVGKAALNLAVCEGLLGNTEEARQVLRRAERAFVRAGHPVADVLILDAKFARELGLAGEAEARLNRAERETLTRDQSAQAYLLRAHIACDRGQPAQAEAFLDRARGRMGDRARPALAADAEELTARILEMTGRYAAAAEAYERQAMWFRQAGLFRDMAEALARAGEGWVAAGEPGVATDRFYRAARSLMAQGEHLGAMRVIEKAVQFQEEPVADEDLVKEIAELFEEIRASVEISRRAGP